MDFGFFTLSSLTPPVTSKSLYDSCYQCLAEDVPPEAKLLSDLLYENSKPQHARSPDDSDSSDDDQLTEDQLRLFEQRVSFTTFEKETSRTSISLVNTHKDFVHSKTSRRFLCGIDTNDYSEYALQWLFDEMVDDNDELVCLRVVDKDSGTSTPQQQKQYRQEAAALMQKVLQKNVDAKAIQLTLEYAFGRVQEVFGQMVQFPRTFSLFAFFHPLILLLDDNADPAP